MRHKQNQKGKGTGIRLEDESECPDKCTFKPNAEQMEKGCITTIRTDGRYYSRSNDRKGRADVFWCLHCGKYFWRDGKPLKQEELETYHKNKRN